MDFTFSFVQSVKSVVQLNAAYGVNVWSLAAGAQKPAEKSTGQAPQPSQRSRIGRAKVETN